MTSSLEAARDNKHITVTDDYDDLRPFNQNPVLQNYQNNLVYYNNTASVLNRNAYTRGLPNSNKSSSGQQRIVANHAFSSQTSIVKATTEQNQLQNYQNRFKVSATGTYASQFTISQKQKESTVGKIYLASSVSKAYIASTGNQAKQKSTKSIKA